MPEVHVNCYMNKRGDFLLIPVAPKGYGGVLVNHPVRLPAGSSHSELGQAARSLRAYCDLSLYDPSVGSPQVPATGEKSPRTFANKWHLVVICFGDTLRVLPTSRDFKGNYWHLYKDPVMPPPDAEDEELGDAILQAFTACRYGPRFDEIY